MNIPGLVVTREEGQRVVIHDEHGVIATVQLVQCFGTKARLRIVAPPNVRIDREEILEDVRGTR